MADLLPKEPPKKKKSATGIYYFQRWAAMDAFSELEDSALEKVQTQKRRIAQTDHWSHRQ